VVYLSTYPSELESYWLSLHLASGILKRHTCLLECSRNPECPSQIPDASEFWGAPDSGQNSSNSVNPLLQGQIMELNVMHSGSGHYVGGTYFSPVHACSSLFSFHYSFHFLFNRIIIIAYPCNHNYGPH
jgi:hypothetical protein